MRDRPLILGALAVLIGILTVPFWHGALPQDSSAAPSMPPPKGAHCIRPAAWMRENHMKLLMQVRDEVVHEGIRRDHESLSACMNCHVSKRADGSYPSVTSRDFFCNSCHGYVGVRIDCFTCHSNRPSSGETTAMRADAQADATPSLTALIMARNAPGRRP